MRTSKLGVVFSVLAGITYAQPTTQRLSDRPYVQATGQATVTAMPDQATIDIGVITQGQTAQMAAAQNAMQTESLLSDLRKLLGPSDLVKTTSYSVQPNYQKSRGGKSTISSYRAANIVRVRLFDMERVGKVIDAAAQSGATTIQNLDFGFRDPQAARSEALRQAG